MGLENLTAKDLEDLFAEPINKETIIIVLTDHEILQLLEGKEVSMGGAYNIIIRRVGD